MLRNVKEMFGYHLQATDGRIGGCKDFLFDEEYWSVRYMVADTGSWLAGKQVLIAPELFGDPKWSSQTFPVLLSKDEIEGAPLLDSHAPVSRKHEKELRRHFGLTQYWMTGVGVGMVSGNILPPSGLATEDGERSEGDTATEDTVGEKGDEAERLRSMGEVTGYQIVARGDEFGQVADFIIDDTHWIIRYLVVHTGGWFSHRDFLVSPEWIAHISWQDKHVALNIVKSSVEDCPVYDPSQPVNREYEEVLYDYHGKPHYWR